MIFWLLNLLISSLLVSAQRGEFSAYGINNRDTLVNSSSTDFVSSTEPGGKSGVANADNPKSVVWNLPASVKLFGQDFSSLRIFESGVISLTGDALPHCPTSTGVSYIAAYWIKTDISHADSEIFYRMEKLDDASTMSGNVDYTRIVKEINLSRSILNQPDSNPIAMGDIKTAIFVTWNNMTPVQGTFVNPGHKLSFQLIIISTTTRSYAVIVYQRLDFHVLQYETGNCAKQALAGLNYVNGAQFYHLELTNFFYLTASKLLYHTNIQAYTTLGRYCLILDDVAVQPLPPRLNCAVNPPEQDPYCVLGVSPNFCNWKTVGIYAHPSFCDRFISCGHNSVITQVHQCRQWTGFNPHFRTCDWAGFYRCLNIRRGQIGQSIQNMQASFAETSLVTIETNHFNTLLFAVHNNTCAGGNIAFNTIDITSCTHFLMCSNTRTIRMICPHGLFYDPVSNSCDWPNKVICTDGKRPKANITRTTPKPTPVTEQTLHVVLEFHEASCRGVNTQTNAVDPGSCTSYIVCNKTVPTHRFHCPFGLLYNRELKVCDYKYNVICEQGERPPIDKTIPIMTLPREEKTTPEPFNIFTVCSMVERGVNKVRDPRSCKQYFVCNRGTVFDSKTCQGDLFFSSETKNCVTLSSSDCQSPR